MDTYHYRFTKEKKCAGNITRMATVEVHTKTGEIIDTYRFTRNPTEEQIQEMVRNIIRDYEMRMIWERYLPKLAIIGSVL